MEKQATQKKSLKEPFFTVLSPLTLRWLEDARTNTGKTITHMTDSALQQYLEKLVPRPQGEEA